ncbi:FGFR1 oncogene partner [Trichonephila inaurata madagascariensis]|uniref:FGFR1 oncogene partner n=1 Tax=Trichonephila inaurata madagascariensis TaxID=2747483 RepID=A0A8X6X1Z8_9ARAC|nr:FGFR1 oncogene partner [Trichonephila inaurata madagascariensis]
MYAEGETELRDLIVQNLETSGFLNKIKAELRAGVFLAFEEDGSLRSKIPLFNKSFDDFIGTSDGKLAVSIVREFLEYFNLNFTLSVFDPEIACTSPCLNRSELCNKLNLKTSEIDGPLISTLLKTKISSEPEKVSSLLTSEKSYNSESSAHEPLESVLENLSTKSKSNYENVSLKDSTSSLTFSSINVDVSKDKENDILKQKSPAADNMRKTNPSLMERLRNESMNAEIHDKEKPKISSKINDKSHSIFKENPSSSNLDDDPFFDVPLPSEKHSFFDPPNVNSFSINSFKDSTLNKLNGNSLLGTEKNTLSSLKNLPSLTGKSKEWSYSSTELPKNLPSLDTAKSHIIQEISDNKDIKNEIKEEDTSKKDPDPESNEESSEQQINSDESIEEDLEEDFSAGLDDLLNSSLSLGDDATSDKTVSQVSVVDGVDHVEPVLN